MSYDDGEKAAMGCIIVLLLAIISFMISVWVMMVGWGLTASSWTVIVVGHLLQLFIIGLMQGFSK